jgi:PAS domain S-box-containing protein
VQDAIGHLITSLGDFPLEPDSGNAWLWSASGKELLWLSKNAAETFAPSAPLAQTHLLSPDRFRAMSADLAHSKPDQLPVRVQQITLRDDSSAQTFTCLSRAVPLKTGGYGILAVAIGAATRMATNDSAKAAVAEPAISKVETVQPEPANPTNIVQTSEATPQRRAFRFGTTLAAETSNQAESADRRENRMRDLRQGLQEDFADLDNAAKDTVEAAAPILSSAPEKPATPIPAEVPPPAPASVQWLSEPRESRRPLRFVWQTDSAGRFVHLSRELVDAVGPSKAMILGQTLNQAAQNLQILETADIEQKMSLRDTWTANAALWPIENTQDIDISIPVEMAGMPVIEHGQFVGFRGYGIARIERAVRLPSTVAKALSDDEAVETDETLVRFGTAALLPLETPVVEKTSAKAPDADVPKATLTNPLPILPDAPVLKTKPAAQNVAQAEDIAIEKAPEPPKPAEPQQKETLSKSEREAFREIARALEKAEKQDAAGKQEKTEIQSEIILPAPVVPDEPVKAGSLQALKKDLAKRSKLRLGASSFDEPELPSTELHGSTKPSAPIIPYDQARRELKPRIAPLIQEGSNAPWATIIDHLPLGLLVTQNGEAVYANRHLLELTEHESFEQFKSQMGASGLFASNENHIQNKAGKTLVQSDYEKSLFTLLTKSGKTVKVEANIQSTQWNETSASLTSVKRVNEITPPQIRGLELDLLSAKSELRELQSVLDTATDGIISIDSEGRILGMNRSSEALFGFDQNELAGEMMTVLFEPESHVAALDYLEGIRSNGVRSIMNDGRDVKGRERNGGIIPLFMTIGRVGEDRNASRFCIVLRDITHWKKVESDLLDAKRAAEDSSTNKTDFLTTVSHEIRTPLNAIIGFSQVMMTESFGPIGNERYKQYARDIHASGEHVVSLVNDLLDLSKVASGKLEMTFASVDMNAVVAACVAMIQPQANAGKVIVRSQLASHLPLIVADERALRQIVINLLSNAAKFTEAGGQVIASTSFTDQGEVVVRVRDTGVGMGEEEVKRAMEPFRQIPGPRSGSGTGLGLPLTKALVEANRAAFSIQSAPQQGTLVEVTFPSTRVLAE